MMGTVGTNVKNDYGDDNLCKIKSKVFELCAIVWNPNVLF